MFQHRLIKFFVSIFVFLILAIVLISILSNERVLVSEKSAYSVTGYFAINGTFPIKRSSIIDVYFPPKELTLWGSWTGDNQHTGKLVSPAFKAPTIFRMFVAGYPNTSGNELFLEQIGTNEKLKLKTNNPGKHWRDIKWVLPTKWRDSLIRVVAIDKATGLDGWLGVSSPLESNWFSLVRSQLPSLVVLPIYTIHFLLFLIPELFLVIFIVQQRKLNPSLILILTITISSLVGYVIFWIYFLNHVFGLVCSIALLLTRIYFLTKLYSRNNLFKLILSVDIALPIIIMFLVGLFYISILYVVNPVGSPEILVQARFLDGVPLDNIIPQQFAEKLYSGADPRKIMGDWLSSDRPPLQAGIILVQRPIMALTGLSYQVLATIAQCSWVAAVWALCRAMNLSGRRIALVFAFLIFSGFFLFNSVYVWPKLFSGALIIFTFTLILQSLCTSQVLSTAEVSLAAAAVALGMLAHSGVVFTLPGIIFLIMRPRYFPGWRRVLIGCTIFALLLAPWIAYQKFYEPPGNRLVKWHLAGVIDIDKRSSLQTMVDSYSRLTTPQIINNKWENLKAIAGSPSMWITSYDTWRSSEFFIVFSALGILNISWLIFIRNLFAKRLKSTNEAKAVTTIFLVCLISLVFWSLVMFGPATTVIHQGSYATMILLFTGLAVIITKLPALLGYFLLGFQIVLFAVTWILTTPPNLPNTLMVAPNIPMILLITVAIVSLAKVLGRLSQEQLLTQMASELSSSHD